MPPPFRMARIAHSHDLSTEDATIACGTVSFIVSQPRRQQTEMSRDITAWQNFNSTFYMFDTATATASVTAPLPPPPPIYAPAHAAAPRLRRTGRIQTRTQRAKSDCQPRGSGQATSVVLPVTNSDDIDVARMWLPHSRGRRAEDTHRDNDCTEAQRRCRRLPHR